MATKSRFRPCERPVETPFEADLAVVTTVRNRFCFAVFADALGEGLGGLWECYGVIWVGF